MSRVLVVEPDATVQHVLDQALVAAGFTVVTASSVDEARALLDRDHEVEVAVVELRAFGDEPTEGLRALRRDHPELPIVVMTTLLTTRLLVELLRLSIADVMGKPFSPRELRQTLERVLRSRRASNEGALDYAAAMAAARRVLASGSPADAEPFLSRARALAPLDPEAMTLLGLCRELAGRDEDADRAYRAALALDSGVSDGPRPWDGLARLASYGGAPLAPLVLSSTPRILVVDDPTSPRRADAELDAVLFPLGLGETGSMAVGRRRENGPTYVLFTGASGAQLDRWLARTFDHPMVQRASDRNRANDDDPGTKPSREVG
ncbi:MAG: response regulator [Myxococcales bacterium]|nr:response regulator [Myxococcales bacterium]